MRDKTIPQLSQATVKPIVHISFPHGDFTDTIGRQVIRVDAVYSRLGGAGSTTRIEIDNSGTVGPRVEDLWDDDHPVNGSTVKVLYEIEGEGYNQFVGVVTGIKDWTRESIVFECASLAELYRGLVGTVLTKDSDGGDGYYPNLPDENVGAIIPWVWGTVNGFTPVLVNEDISTVLTQAVISTDTTLNVQTTDGFAATGWVQINEEAISYTGITSTTFTGCTRGYVSTQIASHAAGNEVIEGGSVDYLVANHDVSSISNIRYINDDGLEYPIETGSSTTLTKPAKITFNTPPIAYIPNSSHKLKFIDLELEGNHAGANNPTYAFGLESDWTEYNYSVIEDGEWVRGDREAGVPDLIVPKGDIVRTWAIVEYHQDETGSGYLTFEGQGSQGNLPASSNTPIEVQEDHNIHLMSAGFELEHVHTLPGAIHNHSLIGAGQSNSITPGIDVWRDSYYTPEWGNFTECYDGSYETYNSSTTMYFGDGAYPGRVSFQICNPPEGVGMGMDIKKMRFRAKYQYTHVSGASQDPELAFHVETGSHGTDFDVFIDQEMEAGGLKDTLTDWYDVDSNDIHGVDLAHSYFEITRGGGAGAGHGTIEIYDMEVYIMFDAPEEGTQWHGWWAWEPCRQVSPSYQKTIDGDNSTYSEVNLNTGSPEWRWTSVQGYNNVIERIIPGIYGGDGNADFKFYLVGTLEQTDSFYSMPHINDFGTTIDWSRKFSPTGTRYGYDLLDSDTYIQAVKDGYSPVKIIEVGAWVRYGGAGGGFTGMTDIGDSDQQGYQSSLAWYPVDDYVTGEWTQFNTTNCPRLTVTANSGKTLRVLRVGYACEFAPREAKQVKKIACDVVGRTGTMEQIITDVLTQDDLMGIPSANIDVGTVSTTAAGALMERVDGVQLLDKVVSEARCHGFWSWDGVFKVRLRPNRDALGSPVISLNDASRLGRGVWSLSDLVNSLEVQYNYNFMDGAYSDSVLNPNATSISNYGKTGDDVVYLDFIRSDADAEAFHTAVQGYLDECFTTVDVSVEALEGMNIEPGDLISVNADGFASAKIEVKEVRVLGVADDMLTVEAKGVKYG